MWTEGTERITGPWTFTAFPQIHAASADDTPIVARSADDGITVGAWNMQDDSVAGDLIHITLGPNHHNNPNGCAFAVGVAYAGYGFFANNYGDLDGLGGNTFGMGVTNLASVTSAQSAGFQGTQKSAGTPLMNLRSVAADALTTLAPLLQVGVGTALDTDLPMVKFVVGSGAGTTVGQIMGDNGDITWNRTIEAVAPSSGVTPLVRVADEASPSSETYLGGKSNGELGLRVYRRSGSGTTAYAYGWLASSDRFKLLVGQGAADKGSEVFSTMIEVRAIAGTGSLGQMGFFGASPTNRPSAYTQTYSTTTRTHAARQAAALTDNSSGTSGGTTLAAVSDTASAANAIATLAAMVNKIITDQVNTAGVVNSLVDDHQALGLAG